MTDCLRFLRLGVINVLGITVPGVLLILFLTAGFFFPLTICVLPLCQEILGSDKCVTWEHAVLFSTSGKTLLLFLSLVLAYIAGYIIRLSTPDDLDRISAKIVLGKMSQEAKAKEGLGAAEDHWPFQGEPDNKFPYFHFRDYLLFRGLKECANLVAWGPPDGTDLSKRSKTHVNMMKLEITATAPELSAIVESNEAHVRLMFGTWVAIMTTRYFVVFGAVLSILGLAGAAVASSTRSPATSPPYGLSLILCVAIFMAMQWAKVRIEHLFHYQRVREIFHIVACFYHARKQERESDVPVPATAPLTTAP